LASIFYTYILKSIKKPGAIYIGYTKDLKDRLDHHNNPLNRGYSKRHAPWVIEMYIAFAEEHYAKLFEIYLKSGSGKAFMKKRLISNSLNEALGKGNRERSSVR
jgi:predicted GIY-YIG superfamily endonuclease